jgi:hypothetical protein
VSEITPAQVQAYYTFMAAQYHATLVHKADSALMTVIAKALGLMGVLDQQAFLTRFTTTVGHTIYLPFTPGIATADYDLWWQVATLAHECQHIVQYERSGAAEFAWTYLTQHASRATYEVEAYTANLELYWWRYHQLIPPATLAGYLTSYACSAADIQVATRQLALRALSVEHGAVVTDTVKVALGWLNQHVPALHTVG